MRITWHSYGRRRNTGVHAYALLPNAIALRFSDGRVYLYDAHTPGRSQVETMQRLAQTGRGLTTYVNRYVRERYAEQVSV